jgi:16S rRNA G1207 methylase RsmC
VDCVEIDYNLATVLTSRVPGANATSVRDFLDVDPAERDPYNRVVMNPPFSGGKDILHITHALRFLKPGGRLVAVMAAGVIWHQSKAAEKFRALVEERGGEFEPLPAGSFAPATDANTVVVVIPAAE